MNLLLGVEKSGLVEGRFFLVNRLTEHDERGRKETTLTCQPTC